MNYRIVVPILLLAVFLPFVSVQAQEAKVHTGFIFYPGTYTVDEETFGLYEEGHKFEKLLEDNPAALASFRSYESCHTTANVFTALSLAAFGFGGITYMPGLKDELPESIGTIAFASGGGLLAVGLVFEFLSWGKLKSASKLYNKDVEVDDGTSLNAPSTVVPLLAVEDKGAYLGLGWSF